DEFLDFQEPPELTLENLLGVHFVHLTLVEKDHLEDGCVVFAHGDAATKRLLRRARRITQAAFGRRHACYAQPATRPQTYPLRRHSPIIRSPFRTPRRADTHGQEALYRNPR